MEKFEVTEQELKQHEVSAIHWQEKARKAYEVADFNNQRLFSAIARKYLFFVINERKH